MAGTFSQIYLQFVFAVKGRQSLIKSEWEDELYKYIKGIIHHQGHTLIAINGMPDHIHILIGMKPGDIPSLVREIKKSSNLFVNERKFCPQKFSWQEGYGVFSYHQSMLDRIVGYIDNQKTHHQRVSFRKEYKAFLEAFEVIHEGRFLFEYIDQ